ncbi:MAG: hypothetical protein F6K22_07260 [Okeania sp. SIO2F4]|uniref:hypothetical protein n=1 Tax=Okeania sp. SIO2F4 TaxID=2607790 RepID=UPI00142A6BE4|nr:hypothetical protein [Okeania sp. SIO2F4]NES02658.1 hypothetical protein [Okeania sp. SIO2F4]NES02659.1 hypothetical protein [Okeania sp. SIO2F4]
MSTYNSHDCGCEFEFSINLKVPVTITPIVKIKSAQPARETLNVNLEPNIQLNPSIGATEPTCLSKNGYHKQGLSTIEAG